MSEDSDTPVFVFNTKDYVKDREDWKPPLDDADSLREENKKLKKLLRNAKQQVATLKKQLKEAQALAPILIDE